MATRNKLVVAVAGRYAVGSRVERGRILDEFAAVTGYYRKHAMRLLRVGQPSRQSGPRPERRVYDAAVREALIVVWEASDRVWGSPGSVDTDEAFARGVPPCSRPVPRMRRSSGGRLSS